MSVAIVPGLGMLRARVTLRAGMLPAERDGRRQFFGSIISDILPAAASIGGAVIGASANKSAASQVANANQAASTTNADAQAAARAQFQQNADQGVAAIGQGVTDYTNTIQPNLNINPVQLPTYRGLTPQQQLGEADTQRQNMATLAASGLRGAGRAGIGAVMDNNARYEAAARAGNDATTLQAQQTASQTQANARSNLAQVQAQAGGAKAATLVGAGNNIAGSLQSQGATTAGLQQATGATQAQSTASTGNLIGNTLGYVAGAGTPNAPGLFGIGSGNSTYTPQSSFTGADGSIV